MSDSSYNLGKLNVIIDASTRPFEEAMSKIKSEASSLNTGMDNVSIDGSASAQLGRVNASLNLVNQTLSTIATMIQNVSSISNQAITNITNNTNIMNINIQNMNNRVSNAARSTANNVSRIGTTARTASGKFEILKVAMISIKNHAVQIASRFKAVASRAVEIGSKGVSAFKNLISHMRSTHSQSNILGSGFRRLASLIKSVFIFNAISAAFTKLRQYMSDTIQQNQQLSNSLAQIKGNLLTAFQPIYNAILPALTSLLNGLATVTGYIAQFTSALFGTSIKSSQNSAQALYNQANAAEQVATSTEKATKATEQATKATEKALGKYDELNVISKTDTSSGSSTPDSGSGSGSGSSPVSGILASFDNIDTNSMITKFVEKLKEAFESGDFTEIGAAVADKINYALSNIPWEKIKNTSNKIAKSIATFLNGFIEELDWNSVGSTIAEGINTAVEFANTFINTFNWDNLGTGLSDAVNGFFDTVDWKNLGNTLSDGLHGVLETINTFIQGVDWVDVGKSAVDALMSIDWATLLGDLVQLVVGCFCGLVELSVGIFSELGKFIVDGIQDGIKLGDLVKDAYNWIKINIFNPITNSFRKIFGISSPSTVFKEYGVFIMQGLIAGIQSMIENVKESITQLAGNVGKWFKDNVATINLTLTAAKDKGYDEIVKIYNSVKSSTVVKTVKVAGQAALNSLKNVWGAIKNSTAVKTVKVAGQAALNSLKTAWNGLKNRVITLSTKLPNQSTITNGMKTLFKSAANAVIGIFNTLVNQINKMMKFTINGVTIAGKQIVKSQTITLATLPTIPKMERGGILSKGQVGLLEGNGSEAVLPLEQNTGWIDKIADRLTSNINAGSVIASSGDIVLELDGNQVIRWIRQSNNTYKKQTGKNILS